MDIPEPLEREVGPFPLWQWLGLAALGIGVGIIIRKRSGSKGAASLATGEGEGSDPAAAGSFGLSPPASSRVPAYGVGPDVGTGSGAAGVEEVTTNLGWSRKAIAWLIAAGVDPIVADSAIRKAMDGYPMTAQERAAYGLAIGGLGAPPEFVPPVNEISPPPPTAPAPTPGPPPTTVSPTPVSVQMAGSSLVSDNGDTILWTDGNAVQWVSNGHLSQALYQGGARVARPLDNGSFEPIRMSRATISAIPHKIGPPPPEWGTW